MASLLLLGLPPRTFIGIDLISFNSSPHFQGIKNIPPGFHFLYSGTDPSLSIRHGHWLQFTGSELTAWKWHVDDERLVLYSNTQITPQDRSGVLDYTELQAADSASKTNKSTSSLFRATSWSEVTNHISAALLSRIISRQGWSVSSLTSSPTDTESIPGLTRSESSSVLGGHDSTFNLLPIDLSRTFPPDSTGRDRTTAARDRSWYLGYLIDTISPNNRTASAGQLIGELQFCFLMTLLLSNWSALQGWKRILDVVFTCQIALGEIPGFFVEVLRVLRAQVGLWDEVEGGLFETEVADSDGAGGGAWLRRLLRKFRSNVLETLGEDGGEVGKEMRSVENLLRERYGWEDLGEGVLRRGMVELEDGERIELSLEGADEEEEKGEWAPVVVELDDNAVITTELNS